MERVVAGEEDVAAAEEMSGGAAAGVERLVQRRAAGGTYVHGAAAGRRHPQARHQVHPLEQVAARRTACALAVPLAIASATARSSRWRAAAACDDRHWKCCGRLVGDTRIILIVR